MSRMDRLGESTRTHLGYRYAPELQIVSADGARLTDAEGNEHIDFLAGWCVANLGWSNPEVLAAIRHFQGPPYVYPHHLYAPWTQLAEQLSELAPGDLSTCWRATGGSEAIEIAMQAAMLATGRGKFVSVEGAYHGDTLGARSIGDERREKFPNRLSGCETLAPPLDAGAVGRLEALLKGRDVAAVVLEPVILNLAVTIPDDDFMDGLREVTRRTGTLLIADEVATGFGRTGKLFACELYELEPDILCLGKAITAGYAPMGATLMGEEVAAGLKTVGVYSTFGWHPIATAAALANLDYWIEHRGWLLTQVDMLGGVAEAEMLRMGFRHGVSVRGRGLAIAADVHDQDYAEEVKGRCRELGLLIETDGTAMTLFPPLTIGRSTFDEGLAILAKSL
jgi:4-aminobutyrate aminotransferase-like enzyme